MDDDVLFSDEGEVPAHDCDLGFVFVSQSYVRLVDGEEVLVEGDAVIPCRHCNPDGFARWAEGQFRPATLTKDGRRGKLLPRPERTLPLSLPELPERADLR